MSLGACTDLDVEPNDLVTADAVLTDVNAYQSFLAKLYAGFSVSGQQGPAGNADIKGYDEGSYQYLRLYWKLQELSTEEAIVAWADGNLPKINTQEWTDDNEFVAGLFDRLFYQISLANEFLRESTSAKLSSKGFSEGEISAVAQFRAEARFIRALVYWHAIDLYANVPFATEEDALGAEAPSQATRQEVFNYIDSELQAIESQLAEPKSVGYYGRADKGALWALQAKLYLNSEVYTGVSRYTECITACNKIINSSAYQLTANYQNNFQADNHNSPEMIFAATFDGQNTQTYGGTTFIIHASVGGSMSPENYGINSGWGGLRVRRELVNLFDDPSGLTDSRALFFTEGQSLNISDVSSFTDGYACVKFTNITSDGNPGSDAVFTDTDFPIFRLADVYLMYAEAVLRGGAGGDQATALSYINSLRQRAYGNNSGEIALGDMSLDFILDERARELYWEGHRRTDLVRFEKFTTGATWQWKGGVEGGMTTESFRDVYPIPSGQLIANPKLTQNTGY